MSGEDWDTKLELLAQHLSNSQSSNEERLKYLTQKAPKLTHQIQQSSDCPPLLKLWGHSTNIDDNTNTEIVSSGVLKTLSQLTGFQLESPILHAGFQHTYGYLFSLIETPYGRKRDRWTQSYLEEAFQFTRPTFAPVVTHGTLLFNLTFFLGRILFRGRRSELGRLRRNQYRVDPELRKLKYNQFKKHRMIEEFGPSQNRVRIITDVLLLPPLTKFEDLHGLLIYGVQAPQSALLSLITAFPVTEAAVQNILQLPVGNKVEVQLKYNAFVHGVTRNPMQGKRTIETSARSVPCER